MKTPRKPGGKVANSLVAMSSAAVMAVYSAGYVRTRSAAAQMEGQSEERRRPVAPTAPVAVAPVGAATVVPVAELKAEAPKAEAAVAGPTPVPVAKKDETLVAKARVPESVAVVNPVPESVEGTPSPVPVPVVEKKPEAPPPPPPPPPAAPVWKDGTYTGWGTSRHGDIQAQVVIEGGRIASATIAQCLTRYSCSVIEKLPPQVAQRQSPEVDYVSGATQSTNAFYYGVVEALNKAK